MSTGEQTSGYTHQALSRRGEAPSRILWLDGLRGVAAVQVVLLHYATAFLPAIGLSQPGLAHYAWERWFIHTPLFLLVDGSFAVYVFFLLSGVALTLSFRARPRAVGRALMRRVVRLGVPMAAAVAIGAVLLAICPEAHVRAAALTGSHDWLGAVSPPRVGLGLVLHQMAFEGMLTGYQDMSLLPQALKASLHLSPLAHSVDAPLWTLHLEFAGSILVLLLVFLRDVLGRWLHAVSCVLLMLWLGASPLVLFVIGHLTTTRLTRPVRSGWLAALGAGLLGLGAAMSMHASWPAVAALQAALPAPALGPAQILVQFESLLGGCLVFGGVALVPAVRRALCCRPVQWLGRISFGLYLVHFPLLFTAVSLLFLQLAAVTSFGRAAGLASLVGIAASLVAAAGFTRWIDEPGVWLSRQVGRARLKVRRRSGGLEAPTTP